MNFRLNSPEGKQILASIRQADYAHPGEEEAIAISFADLSPNHLQRVLDVGCGRGGTADWLWRQGWTNIVGIDRDKDAINYAIKRYPKVNYFNCDVTALDQIGLGYFDLICLFNSFYAFSDQGAALQCLRATATPKTTLRIFDYAQPKQSLLPAALGTEIGQPIVLDRFEDHLIKAGWQQLDVFDLTNKYILWYGSFLNRLTSSRATVVATHGRDWYDFFTQWYGSLHQALIVGELRGVLIRARAYQ